MVYINSKCTCPLDNYVVSGLACVSTEDYTRLREDGYVEGDDEFKVIYNNIQAIGGGDPSALSPPSDVLNEYYLQSAVKCKYYSDHQMCQTLANLCVL